MQLGVVHLWERGSDGGDSGHPRAEEDELLKGYSPCGIYRPCSDGDSENGIIVPFVGEEELREQR